MSTTEEETTTTTQRATTTASDIYFKCRFCGEQMWERGPQFPSLKQLKREHTRVCEKYANWRANNKSDEEIEEEKQKLRLDGKQMMEARLRFALGAIYKKIRLQKELDDPNISPEEKRFKIAGELREVEAFQEEHIREGRKLLNDENEHIREGAKSEWDRCQKMGSMKERWKQYRLF